MNIIFEEKLTEDIKEKYILLELDTFSPEPNVFKKCWALIGKDEGDSVEVRTPGGEKSYEVLKIVYS